MSNLLKTDTNFLGLSETPSRIKLLLKFSRLLISKFCSILKDIPVPGDLTRVSQIEVEVKTLLYRGFVFEHTEIDMANLE